MHVLTAVCHFPHTCIPLLGGVNASAIDGVFVDGAGEPGMKYGLTTEKNMAFNVSHALAVKELSERLHALPNGRGAGECSTYSN
jgi:hypothetical protein